MHIGAQPDAVAHRNRNAVLLGDCELRFGQIAIVAPGGLDADQLPLAGFGARALHMRCHDQATSISLVSIPYQWKSS